MNNIPIKIIHKFKNQNRRIQYIQYIFVGPNVDDNIYEILESIKNKNFYDTIDSLSKNKLERLENYYGKKWYTCFFNRYHLTDQFNSILKHPKKQQMVEQKIGTDWTSSSILRRITYSFASIYHDYILARNKIKSDVIRKTDMDFRTYASEMIGGDNEEHYEEYEHQEEDMMKHVEPNDDNEEPMIKTLEDLDDEVAEDFNLEELTKLYSTDVIETDKYIKDTSKLIGDATNNKQFAKNINKLELNFNANIDDVTYDVKLEDVFIKVYVKEQFIFYDDNIATLRNKITVSIPISDKYGDDIKLLPEYMYFWTEYNHNNVLDRVMLGQKWIRRSEMVKIDIKPNENISVYENLRNNLSYLKDSFGVKIKREDDEYNILGDYEHFMTNNEIYMIDIMNELGLNYNSDAEKKKNIYEVYVNIYFPMISFERFEMIQGLLNNINTKELNKNYNSFVTIKNDMMMEKQIYSLVQETKDKSKIFDKYFEYNYVIQSIIHVNLNNPKNLTGTISSEKYNLYKIFDNFIVSEEYPFIQYQTHDSQLTYKFFTKTKKIDDMKIFSKMFETASYGISFKIKLKELENKYISIGLSEQGKLEYKMTWKEEDMATMESVKQSYSYVNNLLLKINSENNKIKIILPEEEDYKYAFINTIQKCSLPDKYKINHNDLSDFARFFYTYIALVIEPKKRTSKTIDTPSSGFSKYGTYLRYKRISNYENKNRMHMRMLYFIRNFEIGDNELIDEISKQFNITQEATANELNIVKKKYGKHINKSRKIGKLKAMPKSKPPGIGIDIQGRMSDNYKIRITGARSKEQLDEIVGFIRVLIYLYVETYLIKNTKYLKIKETLKSLTKIAKRRNLVNDMVNYDVGSSIVKIATALDKKRLGFKPDEGQNQWTRSCQNSGEDKKRRPVIVSSADTKELLKRGYKLNVNTNTYEKTSIIVDKGNKKQVTVKAIRLPGENGLYNYYTCDPDVNNEHCYVGFLSKSNNPNDLCMPCCFKKDQELSVNKKKQKYFVECLGQTKSKIIDEVKEEIGDKVYILQDTNKVQDGRFIFLPKHLNQLFNSIWENSYVIKNHYLVESTTGYYFKYTIKHPYYYFIAAMSNIFNHTIDTLKQIAIDTLTNDKTDTIFTYLNNGDIRSMFVDRNSMIEYIKNNNYLEYDILGELFSLPGVLTKNGLFYFIFDKKIKIMRKSLEKDVMIENYYLKCLNNENHTDIETDRDCVIMIKDGKYYFPIYNIKKAKTDKKIILSKTINNKYDVFKELKHYYNMSCVENFIYHTNDSFNITAKMIYTIYPNIKKQIIDMRNKVRYVVLENEMLLPVKPSGTVMGINISNIQNLRQADMMDLNDTIKELKKIHQAQPSFKYVPKVINYNNINKKGEMNIISILLMNNMIIPIKNQYVDPKTFKKYGLGYEFQSLEEVIDSMIIKKEVPFDEHNMNVKNRIYRNESYNLLRLEFSMHLMNNTSLKNAIIKIVKNDEVDKKHKRKELVHILLEIITNKTNNQFVELIKELPYLEHYSVSNVREYCNINKHKDKCDMNIHCAFINNSCIFVLYKNDIITNINRLVEELVMGGIKFKEIIMEDNFYVSDIVDYTQFSDRKNQKIIKTSNFNIKKLMVELFGKDNVPQLGKRKQNKNEIIIIENIPEMIEFGKQIIQEIIPNKNSIIRAYVNSYYWLHNTLYDKETRNLGYHSELQEKIAYLFKANIIDYVTNNITNEQFKADVHELFPHFELDKEILSKNIFKSQISIFRKNNFNTSGVFELLVLSYMFPYPIVVFDNFNAVKYIFSTGKVNVNEKTTAKYLQSSERIRTILLKFDYEGSNLIPKKIYSIYYI